MAIAEKCVKCGKMVPWMVLLGNSTMTIFQLYVGYLSQSKGLIADGYHSGTDILCTLMVIITVGFSGRKNDKNHPWGHGKAESFGALLAYMTLLCIAGMILFDATEAIIKGVVRPPHWAAFFAALVAIISNYILSSYGFCAGKKLNSPALIANANENRSDMLSSVAVCIGVFLANLGFTRLDAMAAVLVGLMIGKSGIILGLQALRNLLDESLPESKKKLIADFVMQYREVKGISYINARSVGPQAWIDIEIILDQKKSVKEGHAIAREIRQALMRRFMHIREVTVSFTCKEDLVEKKKTATGRRVRVTEQEA
ncbi:MAG: cation transporter [Candidatus Omnitrophica bacterium]|nr:cation transporter [Candidatus Omnitrophota bacterium]